MKAQPMVEIVKILEWGSEGHPCKLYKVGRQKKQREHILRPSIEAFGAGT